MSEEQEQDDDIEIIEEPSGTLSDGSAYDSDEPLVDDDIRERRRQERMQRKERRTQAIERNKTELRFLETRNQELERRLAQLEGRSVQQEIQNLDAQLEDAQAELQAAERVMAQAMSEGKGDEATAAMRYKEKAAEKVKNILGVKQHIEVAANTPRQQQADPIVVQNANIFVQRNPWYDVNGRDEASRITRAIDETLTSEGYDPRTAEYWQELEDRVSRYIPDKPKRGAPPRGGPNIGGRETSSVGNNRTEFYISPERKQALVDAGVWDDPVLRKKYVKRYMEFDRDNRK